MHPYNHYLTRYAQRLRKEMTPQERHLWYDYLRRYPVQFRRQVPTGEYVVDFYCSRARLAVELDGTQHYDEEARQADEIRTKSLAELGVMVLRFDNFRIERSFATVCEEIDRVVKERLEVLGRGLKGRS